MLVPTLALALALVLGVGCGGGDDAPGASAGTPTTAGGAADREGDDGDPTTTTGPDGAGAPGGTEDPGDPDDVTARACEDLAVVTLDPVEIAEEVAPDDDWDMTDVVAALDRLAESGPGEVRDAATLVLPYLDEGIEPSDEETVTLFGALDTLIEWGAAHCEVGGPIWGCMARSTFVPVGEAIDVEGGTTPPAGEAATPEEAVGPSDDVGERVEVERTDDVVLFAWLDDRGLAVRSELVTRGPDGWGIEKSAECETPGDDGPDEDTFTTVGGPIDG